MKVAFIGLGIMGSRMASNLLKNNVDVTVYNRSKKPLEKLVSIGAHSADSPNDAVQNADIIFSMLAKPEVVDKLFLTENGALNHISKGKTWVDCSTVNPSFSLDCHKKSEERGIHFLDAPVAGTLPHAEKAELVFFVGGDAKVLKKVSPFLDMMGRKTLHIGSKAKGSSYKMLVNMMLAQSMVIFSEAVLLGKSMGLEEDFLLETLPNLVVSAPFTKIKANMIREKKYDVQFPLELMHKDLHLASTSAYETGQSLYLANLTKELFSSAVKEGLGRMDFAAIHQYLEGKI